jgi:hypothetical protein
VLTVNKCVFLNRYSLNIGAINEDFDSSDLLNRYSSEISNLQLVLQSNPCHSGWNSDQSIKSIYCGNATQTIGILEKEILAIKSVSDKPAPESTASTGVPIITSEERGLAAVKSAQSKKLINCIKGKQIKKIKGVNPRCPAGYKKK